MAFICKSGELLLLQILLAMLDDDGDQCFGFTKFGRCVIFEILN